MEENNGLRAITDVVSTMIDSVPAPIKRNFLKAIGQLSMAAVDVPIAWLEGKSGEMRAASQARIQIIKTEGDKLSQNIDIPQAFIDRAAAKFAQKIIKEQINLDAISHSAAKELASASFGSDNISDKEISEDWLNEFENNAKQMSSEEMRFIFGKILANEAIDPGNFSIRTIRLISQLDNSAAKLFKQLCSCAISMELRGYIDDVRVVAPDSYNSGNSLGKYGLHYNSLNILQEYGLIIADYNSYIQYENCVLSEDNTVGVPVKFCDEQYVFIPTDRLKYEKEVRLNGVSFTNSGKELYKIVPKDRNDTYFADLQKFLEERHLQLGRFELE